MCDARRQLSTTLRPFTSMSVIVSSVEHSYLLTALLSPIPKPRRILPLWLVSSSDQPHASCDVHKASPDGIFNYGSAVLNDGLLLLEFRDAIHEGDGPRIIGCWKFLLLYFHFAGHTKYAQEALNLQFLLNGATSPRLANHAATVGTGCKYTWWQRTQPSYRLTHGTSK